MVISSMGISAVSPMSSSNRVLSSGSNVILLIRSSSDSSPSSSPMMVSASPHSARSDPQMAAWAAAAHPFERAAIKLLQGRVLPVEPYRGWRVSILFACVERRSSVFAPCVMAARLAWLCSGVDDGAPFRGEALVAAACQALAGSLVELPRAVACVAEAKVPHLRAELAYVDAFARDDVLLGAEGYALTTLSCALDVLADGDDSGEQPVLDLGGESWPAPPAPPPASPLGGEEWPEPL